MKADLSIDCPALTFFCITVLSGQYSFFSPTMNLQPSYLCSANLFVRSIQNLDSMIVHCSHFSTFFLCFRLVYYSPDLAPLDSIHPQEEKASPRVSKIHPQSRFFGKIEKTDVQQLPINSQFFRIWENQRNRQCDCPVVSSIIFYFCFLCFSLVCSSILHTPRRRRGCSNLIGLL